MWSSRKASRILPTRNAAPGNGIDSSGHRLVRGRLVAQADDQHLVGAQAQRGRQRRVLAQAAVAEEAFADADRREQDRQRRRRQRVLGAHGDRLRAHERVLAPLRDLAARVLHEHDGLARADVGRRDRQRLQVSFAQVVADAAPGDQAAHDAFELLRLHDAAQPAFAFDLLDVAAAQQRRGRAHELLHAEGDHLLEHEVLPALDQHAPLLVGHVGRGRVEAGVDRPHRRAAHDVELHLPAQIAGQILADVAHDARFVGAAGAAARQDQGDAGSVAAILGPRRSAHPIPSG